MIQIRSTCSWVNRELVNPRLLLELQSGQRLTAWTFSTTTVRLDPARLDLIILPELQKAFVINSEPYAYTPKFVGEMITLDFEENLNTAQLMKQCGDEIRDCQIRVNQHITRARKASEKAKATHDLMEMYYVPAMNFSELDKKMDSILQRILVYTEGPAIAAMTTIAP